MKTCGQCGETKPLVEFSQKRGYSRHLKAKTGDGRTEARYYQSYCKACYNAARRFQKIRQVYGITREQYMEMLQRQNGSCAICEATPGKRWLAVDHNHETGEVRGLLCESCNNGIGRFQDSPELLRAAAEYLSIPVHTLA